MVDFTSAVELILDDKGQVAGAVLQNMETGEYLVARAKVVIIATGGPGMVKAAYSAGKPAIGVGAANLVEPYACKTIIENLPAVMERYGMENLTEIIGGAHHG